MAQTLKRTGGILIIALIVAFAFCLEPSMAATKTMKTYDVIKSGSSVYCLAGTGIYKVNIKSGSVKKLVKNPGEYGHYRQMAKKGKYLYYIKGGTDVRGELYRVKISGGKTKKIAGSVAKNRCIQDYVIKGKKIYYKDMNGATGKTVTKSMKLNGKGKKKSSANVKSEECVSNVRGYTVMIHRLDKPEKGYYETVKYWLQTPDGKKFNLGKKSFH